MALLLVVLFCSNRYFHFSLLATASEIPLRNSQRIGQKLEFSNNNNSNSNNNNNNNNNNTSVRPNGAHAESAHLSGKRMSALGRDLAIS